MTPFKSISELNFLAPGAHQEILSSWSTTLRDVSGPSLASLFEKQAAENPDAIAACMDDNHFTFSSLNNRANQLARYLIKLGLKPEDTVAVHMQICLEVLVVIWALAKSGITYLPLDPTLPADRLASIIDLAEPAIIITHLSNDSLFSRCRQLRFDPHFFSHTLSDESENNITTGEQSLNAVLAAYIIFTSGSTGEPKGAVVTHAGIPSMVLALNTHLSIESGSRLIQLAPMGFDMSLWEIWAAGVSASTLILSHKTRLSGEEIGHLLCRELVTHFSLPPSRLRNVPIPPDLPVEVVSIGGELCPADLLATWCSGRRVLNGYGQTETTVNTTISLPLDKFSPSASIGRPIWNTTVYVLDSTLALVPPGVNGELYISGPCVARGYIKKPAATAERFVACPFGPSGTRMYRTGDVVRWTANGSLEFIGRVDDQVKVRGFRVELAEVEAAVRRLGVGMDVAAAVKGTGENKILVLYIRTPHLLSLDTEGLRRELARMLPDYMVPSRIIRVDTMPLTLTGKLDRKALPEPPFAANPNYRSPATEQEKALSALFAEVLGVDRVGLDDNFFDLGGHSLTAVNLITRMRSRLGIDIDLGVLFERPTVAQLSLQMSGASPRPDHALRPRQRSVS